MKKIMSVLLIAAFVPMSSFASIYACEQIEGSTVLFNFISSANDAYMSSPRIVMGSVTRGECIELLKAALQGNAVKPKQ